MYAKNTENTLASLYENSDISSELRFELPERFSALRSYGKLPRGRERREQSLSHQEIVSALLGLSSVSPNWAGHAAIVLTQLQPVGGVDASFFRSPTLGAALALILADETARESLTLLRVTAAETGVNSNGGATLIYQLDGARRTASYVPREAVSLLQKGAELTFDPDNHFSPIVREISFNRNCFQRLAVEYERSKLFPKPPAGDGSEYNEEEKLQERLRNLGVTPRSRFLNVGVDNQVTWPSNETLVRFDKCNFILMPKTAKYVQSIHVDLVGNRLDVSSARTAINRFLSIMTWCDDSFAVAQGGWSGTNMPSEVQKRDLAFQTSTNWFFDRKPPSSPEAMRALALYREALNAEAASLISYSVLNFYKIIEIKNHERGAVKNWFRDNFDALRKDPNHVEIVRRFEALCGDEPPHEYIYTSCRIAVAHAGKDSESDPDDEDEIIRLNTASRVLQILARKFIRTEFAISDLMFSGT